MRVIFIMKPEHTATYRGGYEKKTIAVGNVIWPIYALVSLVAVGCYLNGINGCFVHDDIPAITLNKDVLALNPISHVFRNDFWGTPMASEHSHKSYRPLTILTFRANYLYFGLHPMWFHLTNVLLHAVACVLFTRVCLCVAGLTPAFATLTGMLFAVHPIHTEAVTGIVGRADVLASIFFLLSLLAYHGYARCYPRLSIICGGLSMLAKETGITVFLLNVAYDFYLNWHSIKRSVRGAKWSPEVFKFIKRVIRVLTSAGVLLAIRLAILQGSLPKFGEQDNPAAYHPSLYVRFLSFCYLAAFNWWLLVSPSNLSHDWQMGSVPLVTSISDPRNLLTAFFAGLALLLTARCVIDFEYQKKAPVVLGFLLLVLPFLPASNLILTVGFVVAERVLYLPSLGCTLLVVYGIQELMQNCQKHRQTIVCLAILLIVTGSLRTIIRNKDWRSRESLLRSGLMSLPHNAKMHYNFANFLKDTARTDLARSHYLTALKLWPTYASAYNNLGTIVSNDEEAERHFLAAIKFSGNHVNAHYNLGKLYRKTNRTLESEKMLSKCISLEASFTPAYIELAKLKGANDKGIIQLLRKVVKLNPTNPYYSTLFGYWLLRKGSHSESLKCFWIALSISPTYTKAITGALRVLRKLGQKSRGFQIITRWYLIMRAGEDKGLLNLNVYLQGWQLKTELESKANAYVLNFNYRTNSSSSFCRKDCRASFHELKTTTKWSPQPIHYKNSTITKSGSALPFLLGRHFLDNV